MSFYRFKATTVSRMIVNAFFVDKIYKNTIGDTTVIPPRIYELRKKKGIDIAFIIGVGFFWLVLSLF